MRRLWWEFVLCSALLACNGVEPQTLGIGETPVQVTRTLGRPDRRQVSLGLVFWDYERRGLTLLWDENERIVRAVVLMKSSAGAVEGIAVGDSVAAMATRWGDPARIRQEGRYLDFVRPRWVQTAEVRGGRIVEITVLMKDTP